MKHIIKNKTLRVILVAVLAVFLLIAAVIAIYLLRYRTIPCFQEKHIRFLCRPAAIKNAFGEPDAIETFDNDPDVIQYHYDSLPIQGQSADVTFRFVDNKLYAFKAVIKIEDANEAEAFEAAVNAQIRNQVKPIRKLVTITEEDPEGIVWYIPCVGAYFVRPNEWRYYHETGAISVVPEIVIIGEVLNSTVLSNE